MKIKSIKYIEEEVFQEDFLKECKVNEKYKAFRFKAKSVNFSLIFNTTAYAFAKRTLEQEWKLQEAKDYVEMMNLQENVDDKIYKMTKIRKEKYENDFNDEQSKKDFAVYWTVAEDIRKKFFEKYSGVEAWIKKGIKFAKENGYVVSPFAQIRQLPQLLYVDPTLNKKDEFDREILRQIKSYSNISCNSPVQSYEIFLIASTMIGLCKEIKEKKLKSILIGQIHDSILFYIYKGEEYIVKEIAKKYFEQNIVENKGIPMELDCEISDYSKGEIWKFGHEI